MLKICVASKCHLFEISNADQKYSRFGDNAELFKKDRKPFMLLFCSGDQERQ